jgi:hypothetical protein
MPTPSLPLAECHWPPVVALTPCTHLARLRFSPSRDHLGLILAHQNVGIKEKQEENLNGFIPARIQSKSFPKLRIKTKLKIESGLCPCCALYGSKNPYIAVPYDPYLPHNPSSLKNLSLHHHQGPGGPSAATRRVWRPQGPYNSHTTLQELRERGMPP